MQRVRSRLLGIIDVVVNGVIVMKDQEPLKGVNPGQPIRFEPVKSRFEPLTIENWQKAYYAASPIDFGGGAPGFTAEQGWSASTSASRRLTRRSKNT